MLRLVRGCKRCSSSSTKRSRLVALATLRTFRTFSSMEKQPWLGQDVEATQALLKTAQAVCFDVDSTVIMEEGIDVLAAYKGVGDAVVALTAKAMGGTVLFQDALKDRLDIIKPSRQDIDACMLKHPLKFTPGLAFPYVVSSQISFIIIVVQNLFLGCFVISY